MYIYLHLNEYKQQCNTTYSAEISQTAVFKKLTFLNIVTESFFPMSMKTNLKFYIQQNVSFISCLCCVY